MSDYNQEHNVSVWFDIYVSNLERAVKFYKAVLNNDVKTCEYEGFQFAVFEHDKGNGGCLVVNADKICADKGILLYLNVDGRIKQAITEVDKHGGKIIEKLQAIGPHGFRAIIKDSEGNHIALHSTTD